MCVVKSDVGKYSIFESVCGPVIGPVYQPHLQQSAPPEINQTLLVDRVPQIHWCVLISFSWLLKTRGRVF